MVKADAQKTLALARFRAKLKVSEVAERAGMTPSAVSQVLTGARKNPRPLTIARLADALGVPLEEVFDKEGAA